MKLYTECWFFPDTRSNLEKYKAFTLEVRFEDLDPLKKATHSEQMKELIHSLPNTLKDALYLEVGSWNFCYTEVKEVQDEEKQGP